MKLNKLNFLSFLFLVLFLCLSLSFFVSANDVEKRGLEVNYPIINGIEITTESTIADYAVYFFSLAMIMGAILAFAVLIYGGFRYITSAGDPLAMSDAKKWILGAILGLMLLLCTWFIIGIINKEMLSPKIPDIEAPSGIYLIGKDKTKIPYTQDVVNSIPEWFEVDYIEFISDPPEDLDYANPDKDELCSVYIYDEKNLEGEAREEIKNTGVVGTKHYVSNVGSMFLLWHEPGVYFYKEEGYDKEFNNPPRPKFLQTSQASFKEDFDNKIKSLRFVDNLSSKSSNTDFYYAVLFEEPNFNRNSKGKCQVRFFSIPPIGNFKISSIAIFKTAEMHGEVIFYDEINQKGNADSQDLTGHYNITVILSNSESESGVRLEEWNSIAINANAIVILCTKEYVLLGGYCRLFNPLGHDGDNLKTTSIYHRCYGASNCEEYLPKQAFIIPRQE